MTNLRTTIGGALGTLGTSLLTLGTGSAAVQFMEPGGVASKWQIYMIFAGGIVSAAGKFFTALFAADAKEVQSQLNVHTAAIAEVKGDTAIVTKTVENLPKVP